jgi:hypothetical protein
MEWKVQVILMDAVEYFRFVRDIPFKIPVSAHEPLYTCVGKHVVLKTLLSSLGLKVRYAFCEWRWSSLDLPKSLKALPHEDRLGHVYLEVYNKEQKRWMIVDATWDKRLGSKLPISEWDGKSDTVIVVKPTRTLRKKADNLERASEAQWKEYMKVEGQFVEAFNRWLESIRANT